MGNRSVPASASAHAGSGPAWAMTVPLCGKYEQCSRKLSNPATALPCTAKHGMR